MWQTHEVFNQVPLLADYDLFGSDRVLQDAVVREGAGWHVEALARQGAGLGSGETRELAELHKQQGKPPPPGNPEELRAKPNGDEQALLAKFRGG